MITVTISSFKEIIFSKGEAAFICVAYGSGCIRSVRAVSEAVVALGRAVVGRTAVDRAAIVTGGAGVL